MSVLSLDQKLFIPNIRERGYWLEVFNDVDLYNIASDAGKFHLEFGRQYEYNRSIPRDGEWSTSFPSVLMPEAVMPQYNPDFSKSFSDVTDQRGFEVKKILNDNPDIKIALYYSGGIDSTAVLVSLLKNLNKEELSRLTVAMSFHSVSEYPTFFEKYILNKLDIADLTTGDVNYSTLKEQGYYVITADNGDSMFGTELGTHLYQEYKRFGKNLSSESLSQLDNLMLNVSAAETHYSKFEELLISYFHSDSLPWFGESYYNKIVHNINTSTIGPPIYSLHDFFWWTIFNVKWMSCAIRGPVWYGRELNIKDSMERSVINWFSTVDYQLWSMANNNNGQKLNGTTAASYKWAARKYIYDFTKDDWYHHFKLKLASLWRLGLVESERKREIGKRWAVDSDYNIISLSDPSVKEYIVHHLSTCKMDW